MILPGVRLRMWGLRWLCVHERGLCEWGVACVSLLLFMAYIVWPAAPSPLPAFTARPKPGLSVFIRYETIGDEQPQYGSPVRLVHAPGWHCVCVADYRAAQAHLKTLRACTHHLVLF